MFYVDEKKKCRHSSQKKISDRKKNEGVIFLVFLSSKLTLFSLFSMVKVRSLPSFESAKF